MTLEQAQATVALLQDDTLYYRNFGVWWWWIKRELRRLGFDRRQLVHLGDFTDPGCERYYADRPPAELAAEAFDYQADAAMRHPRSPWVMGPDGEPYWLHDDDVE